MATLMEHPTVRRYLAQANASAEQALEAAVEAGWLRQICLEARDRRSAPGHSGRLSIHQNAD